MIHGVLFIMQFITASAIGIQIPIDMSIVLCFIMRPLRVLLHKCLRRIDHPLLLRDNFLQG